MKCHSSQISSWEAAQVEIFASWILQVFFKVCKFEFLKSGTDSRFCATDGLWQRIEGLLEMRSESSKKYRDDWTWAVIDNRHTVEKIWNNLIKNIFKAKFKHIFYRCQNLFWNPQRLKIPILILPTNLKNIFRFCHFFPDQISSVNRIASKRNKKGMKNQNIKALFFPTFHLTIFDRSGAP